MTKIITNDFLHNIGYIGVFHFFPLTRNLIYFTPLTLHFAISIANFIFFRVKPLYLKSFVQSNIDTILANKTFIKRLRCKIEILLLVLIIFFTTLGKGSFIHILIYGNFLRIKYPFSRSFQMAMKELDQKLENFCQHRWVPGFIGWVVRKFRKLMAFAVKF